MNKNNIYVLIFITFLTFGNSLFNDFSGDDLFLIVRNDFYKSWDNLPRLFKKDYLMDSTALLTSAGDNDTSGSVVYSPVLSLTYFFDYGIWKLNPFGYHLTNLFFHTLNTLLVYRILLFILNNAPVSFLSALLFSIHPVKSDVVCAVSYRAYVLLAFFVLLSFLTYIRFKSNKKNIFWLLASCISYFLAVFTKEAAVILPLLILAYDWYFHDTTLTKLKSNIKPYSIFIGITLFYLYIYFFVFGNTALTQNSWLGWSPLTHLASIFWIWAHYTAFLFFPFLVQVLPPLYSPPLEPFLFLRLAASLLFFLGYLFLIRKFYRGERVISFFLVWFLISWIPVSNIYPLVNPIAYRFVYLPSVGLLAVLGIILYRISLNLSQFKILPTLPKIFTLSFVALCMVLTYALNGLWKNTYTYVSSLVELYPNHFKGYEVLASIYYNKGLMEEARLMAARALDLGSTQPRVLYILGVTLLDDPEHAEYHFQKTISWYPQYPLPYIALARMYIFQGKYEKAIPYLKKSLDIKPFYTSFGYLIQCYLLLGNDSEAQKVLEESRKHITTPYFKESLENFVRQRQSLKQPIDIGI